MGVFTESFNNYKCEFQKIMQETMRSQTTSSLPSPTKNDSILKELKSMKQYLTRHDEMVKIMTSTLPSSVDKLKNDTSQMTKIYDNFSKAIQSMNDSIIPLPKQKQQKNEY